MTSSTHLPPTHHTEPSNLSEVSDFESQLIGLMISPDIPGREDGLHGSRFIECMDYSISSFEAELCGKKCPSKMIGPLNALPPSAPPSPPSRQTSRGFGSLIRLLSLRSAPKRDISPNSATSQLLQFKPESPNCDSINSVKLGRRISHKTRRTSSPLVIETGKAESWCTGLTNKTFTPSFLLNSSPSPISLSSSTSGFSGESSLASNSRSKTYLLSEALLGAPRPKRSNSMTEIHQSESNLPSAILNSIDDSPRFEFLNRPRFSHKTIGSQRRDKMNKSYIPGSSLILSKLPQVKKKPTDKSI